MLRATCAALPLSGSSASVRRYSQPQCAHVSAVNSKSPRVSIVRTYATRSVSSRRSVTRSIPLRSIATIKQATCSPVATKNLASNVIAIPVVGSSSSSLRQPYRVSFRPLSTAHEVDIVAPSSSDKVIAVRSLQAFGSVSLCCDTCDLGMAAGSVWHGIHHGGARWRYAIDRVRCVVCFSSNGGVCTIYAEILT